MANESISAIKKWKPPNPGVRRVYRLLGLGIDPVTNQYIYDAPFGGWNTDANWDEFVAEESQWRLKVGVRYRF